MDDSLDRAQLLHPANSLSPSLCPASPAKGQSQSENDTSKHGHMQKCTATIKPSQAHWMWGSMEAVARRPNGGEWVSPWSLVRLLVMISLILLICSESYQAVQAGACLLQSLRVPFLIYFFSEKAFKLHAFQMRIRKCVYINTWSFMQSSFRSEMVLQSF